MDQRERTWIEGIPPALVLALGAQMFFGGLLDGIGTYLFQPERIRGGGEVAQWLSSALELSWRGLSIAVTALAIAAYLDLSRRVPRRQAPLLLVGVGALGVLLLLSVAWLYLLYWWMPADQERWQRYKAIAPWLGRVRTVAALVASGALIGAGWDRREVRFAAAPLLVATALVFPVDWLRHLLEVTEPWSGSWLHWVQLALDLWLRAMWIGATLFVAGSIGRAVPSPTGWHHGGRGLHLAGSALIARVVVAAAVVVLTLMIVSAHSGGLVRALAWMAPLAVVATIVALVAGLLQGASTSAAGAPRLRLYLAAGLLTWTAVVQAIQGTVGYRIIRMLDGDGGSSLASGNRNVLEVFQYATPVVGLAALLCALSAAAAMRRRIPDGAPPDGSIEAAAVMVIISTVATLLLQKWIRSGIESSDGFFFATLLIAVATAIGQLAVGRVLHRVGAAMQEVPELPVATVAEIYR